MSKRFTPQNGISSGLIALFAVGIYLSIGLFQPVSANASAIDRLDIQLNTDLSATISSQVSMTNNDSSGRVINTWKFVYPFNNVANYTVTYNDIPADFSWQSLGNTHELTVRLGGNSIKPGSTGVFKVNFTTNSAVTQQGEYKLFEFPGVTVDYEVSEASTNVTFPIGWGESLFSNAEIHAEARRLVAPRSGAVFAYWLPETVSLRAVQSFAVGDTPTAVNLVPNIPGQRVAYPEMDGLRAAGVDNWGNLWGITNKPKVNLAADIQLTPAAHDLPTNASCSLVQWPETDFNQASTAELVHAAVVYLNQTYTQPPTEGSTKTFSTPQLRLKWEQKQAMSPLEQVCAISSLLSAKQLPHSISYGYYALPGGKFYQFDRPVYWLEVEAGEGQLVFDPQFESIYGAGISLIPDQARLVMGCWNPDNVYARSFSEIPAPKFTSNPFPGISGEVKIDLTVPAGAYSGEFYGVPLRIHSAANHIVPIQKLLVGGMDYTSQAVNLAPGLRKALLPGTTTDLQLEYLREPNFLYSGDKELQVELSLASEISPLVTDSGRTRFVVDTSLLAALAGGSVLATLVLLLTFSRSLLWPHLRRRQLQRKYLQHKMDPIKSQTASRGKPKILSKSVERDIIRFGDV